MRISWAERVVGPMPGLASTAGWAVLAVLLVSSAGCVPMWDTVRTLHLSETQAHLIPVPGTPLPDTDPWLQPSVTLEQQPNSLPPGQRIAARVCTRWDYPPDPPGLSELPLRVVDAHRSARDNNQSFLTEGSWILARPVQRTSAAGGVDYFRIWYNSVNDPLAAATGDLLVLRFSADGRYYDILAHHHRY